MREVIKKYVIINTKTDLVVFSSNSKDIVNELFENQYQNSHYRRGIEILTR